MAVTTLPCEKCDRFFGSARTLRAHCRAAHGEVSWTSTWIVDTVCPVCGVQFWSTYRLRRHLDKGSLACAMQLRLGDYARPSEEEISLARQAESVARRAAKKAGVTFEEAPLPAVPLAIAIGMASV